MKTIKLFTLVLCACYLMACEKERGPEKTLYPQNYVYAGVELHPSKYYRWEGGNAFTELPGVVFPEDYSDAILENDINEYYELFFPILQFTLENDTLFRVITRETDDYPEIDTTGIYTTQGNLLTFFDRDTTAIPYPWHLNSDLTRLESRGYGYHFNYYDSFQEERTYSYGTISEGDRLDKTEMELLDQIVQDIPYGLQPNDTIQLKLFEVILELE